jgi:hypothetical protein
VITIEDFDFDGFVTADELRLHVSPSAPVVPAKGGMGA